MEEFEENGNSYRMPKKSGKITAIQVVTTLFLVLEGFLFLIFFIACLTVKPTNSTDLVAMLTVLVLFVLPIFVLHLVFALVTLSRLHRVKDSSQLTGLAICNLIFFNFITGILYLCLTDKEIENYQVLCGDRDIKFYAGMR